ncbi:protein kinase [Actinoplanes sp. NPDC048988]|uniref:serine/threonine-protein kinase n=1 Tax=Actinoplanes sp. NPDC048988 TaxID=3363901 RepID=UPI00370F7E98
MESGQLIGDRYRLRERLGRGGMAVVWRADDEVLGREVAVKVLSPDLAGDPDLRRRIRDEARAAARLRHVNVVAVYDYGEFGEGGHTLSYVVMELVDGRTLADMLTGGPLPWKVAVLVGAQVAAALAAAHADGVVHRDVKPANIMVTASGVKLVDFGISATVGALDGQDGQVLGTPAYLAPERIAGGPVRPATDVYALGLVLHLALAGRMPWDASTVTQMVKAHVYAKPAPLPAIAGLPSAVTRLVARCLTKNAADRPSSIEASEVLGELAGLPPASLMRRAAGPALSPPKAPARRGLTRPPAFPAPRRTNRAHQDTTEWPAVPASQRTSDLSAADQATGGSSTAAHQKTGELAGPAGQDTSRLSAVPAGRRPQDHRHTSRPAVAAAGRRSSWMSMVSGRRRSHKLFIAAGVAAGMLTAGGVWWADSPPSQPAQAAAVPSAPSTGTTSSPGVTRPADTGAADPPRATQPAGAAKSLRAAQPVALPHSGAANPAGAAPPARPAVRTVALNTGPGPAKAEARGKAKGKGKAPKKPHPAHGKKPGKK